MSEEADEARRARTRIVIGGLAGALLVLPCTIAVLAAAWLLSGEDEPPERGARASAERAEAAPPGPPPSPPTTDPFVGELHRLAAAMLAAGRGQPVESPFGLTATASAIAGVAALGPAVEWTAIMAGVEACRTSGEETRGVQAVVMVFPDGRVRLIDVQGPFPVLFPEITRRRLPASREADRHLALAVERMLALLSAHCAVEPLGDADLARLPAVMAERLRGERALGRSFGLSAACADVQQATPAAFTWRNVQDVVLLLRSGDATAVIGGDVELGMGFDGLVLTPLRAY